MENRKNALTEEQKKVIEENFTKMSEKELFDRLAELGPAVDENAFAEALHAVSAKIEEGVFSSEVSEEELETASGGAAGDELSDPEGNHCEGPHFREIYEGEFPNCASTVEDDSWCFRTDACISFAVVYKGMKHCKKAWE